MPNHDSWRNQIIMENIPQIAMSPKNPENPNVAQFDSTSELKIPETQEILTLEEIKQTGLTHRLYL